MKLIFYSNMAGEYISSTNCGSCDLIIRPITDKEDKLSIQHHYDAYKVTYSCHGDDIFMCCIVRAPSLSVSLHEV